jgi:hypothetical protein
VLLQFLAHFRNPLVASAILALTGDATGALNIGLIVLMSVTLDFVQAYRAGRPPKTGRCQQDDQSLAHVSRGFQGTGDNNAQSSNRGAA